jgi:Protein of unknown function (DUF2793)
MTTELLGLDEISSSQASKEVTHNTALRQMEGRLLRAKDKDLTTPPGSPAAGDTYIIPSGASGVWASKTNQIAHFYGGAWSYWTPIEGVRLWLNDEDTEYVFDGTNWVVLSAPGSTPPFADTTAIIKGSATSSKQARFEVDGLTASTTRVLTVQNKDYTLAGTDDVATSTAAAAADLAAHVAASDPHTGYQRESEKGAANGYASLDSGTLVPAAQLPALVGDSGSGGTKGAAPAPAAGDAAAGKFLKADGSWSPVSGAAGGTVTSVALTVPAELSVSGSPITASGTLAVTKANQSANQVYAGPTSGGAAAPAFRALVAGDIPAQPYDVGAFSEAAPTASQIMLRHVFARQVIFPSGLSPSQGVAGTAATGSTVFDIQKNGSSAGSMTFAASGTTATFAMSTQTTFAAGDKLTVVAPATPDATLAKIAFTLAGTR